MRCAAVRAVLVGLLAAAGLLTVACTRLPPPAAGQLLREGPPPEVPVVFVPGVTGSLLRDRATGELAWGAGRNLLVPRDGGYALAYPVAPPAAWEPRLEPAGVLEEVRLGPVRQPVYGPLLEALEARGYRRGDLAAPRPGDSLFGFAYDWRRSNVESAGELVARLDALRRARGEERLTVDLLCQSSGTPGDVHATLESQLFLTPGERARLVGQPFLVQGGHFELILDPATHRRIHEALQTAGC